MRHERLEPISRRFGAENRCKCRSRHRPSAVLPQIGIGSGQSVAPMASRRHVSRTGTALMKQFWLKFFTWWNGQTFGTQLWTWRFGERVGLDEQGNRYYQIGRAHV